MAYRQGMEAASQPPMRLMTMQITRVRDGRVIEQRPEVQVMSDSSLDPYDITSAWPPCKCVRCRGRA